MNNNSFAWLKTLKLGSQVYVQGFKLYRYHNCDYLGYITKIGRKYIYVGKSEQHDAIMDDAFSISTGESKTGVNRIWPSKDACEAEVKRSEFATNLYRSLGLGTFQRLPLEELQQIAQIVGYKQEGK